MNKPPTHTTRSCHFFAIARRCLSEEEVARIWKKSISQVYRWCVDPDLSDDASRNPIDLLQVTMSRLAEIGRDDAVAGALRVLASPFGYDVTPRDIHSDKNSATREVLDINAALGAVSKRLNDCLADGEIDAGEAETLLPIAAALVRQTSELLDAIHKRRS